MVIGTIVVFFGGGIFGTLVACKVIWYFTSGRYVIKKRLDGKTYVITGATSGIGLATARELAKHGASLILLCRNTKRAEELNLIGPKVKVIKCELNRLESVRQAAAEINKTTDRIDVLINNAGMGSSGGSEKKMTEDGLEMVMASNYFGHFLLTRLLLPTLKASQPSRIISVSSLMHQFEAGYSAANLNFEEGGFTSEMPYNYSKLAQIHFTTELAARLRGEGVVVNALHPGFVKTNIFGKNNVIGVLIGLLAHFFKNPLEGAQTSLYLAVADEVENVTGLYFADCKPKTPTLKALDAKLALEVWNRSCDLVGVSNQLD